MEDTKLLAELRRWNRALPETVETITFGSNPTFKAGRKPYAVLDRYKGVRCLCFRVPDRTARVRLLRDDRFFEPPYDPRKEWIALRTDGLRKFREIEPLLDASYRAIALKRMLDARDGAGGTATSLTRPRRRGTARR
jgi:predicted DNA-binding protein (MmcQ/YjbR family)